MCGWGGEYKRDCSLRHKKDQSHPAQRGRICDSPGIPSDWTEGPSHGSGAKELQTGMPRGLLGRCLMRGCGTCVCQL